MSKFIELGYNVCIPFGDCERYDFIVDFKNEFLRIQCKTASSSDNGKSIKINGRTNMKINGHVIHHKYSKDEIDYIATYYNNECYLIPIEEMGSAKNLRFVMPANFQKERVNFADDYTIENILSKK